MSTSIPAFDAVLAGVFERRTHVAPIVVGITGPDTSGKSQMASRMQAVLAQSGVAATIVHVDDFHNPKKYVTTKGSLNQKRISRKASTWNG